MENHRNTQPVQQQGTKPAGPQQGGAAGGSGQRPAPNPQGQYQVGGGAALGNSGPHVPPAYAPQVTQTTNMYSQLESMMLQVRKEAKSLEAVKSKIKEMDGLRVQVGELKSTLQEAEQRNAQMQVSST